MSQRPGTRHPTRPAVLTVLATVVICITHLRPFASARVNAFIGYSEKAADCTDQLPDCLERSRGNGCLFDAFKMRKHCPATCAVPRCASQGSKQYVYKGHATMEGTVAFAERAFETYTLPNAHFTSVEVMPGQSLMLSRLGMGTYLGNADSQTDESVVCAILYTLTHGWNVLDTASNYRWGRAEESVGSALSVLLAGERSAAFAEQKYADATNTKSKVMQGDDAHSADDPESAAWALLHTTQGPDITRDMLFISTKAGFTTPALVDKLIEAGSLTQSDVVDRMHSMHPADLRASLTLSLERMRLETVDLFYLHNAAEVQIPSVGKQQFMERLLQAFKALEDLRSEGKIRYYGLATWDCFRRPPDDPIHVSLATVVALATRAGGTDHGFRFVQLPVNVAMPEAWLEPWQTVGDDPLTFLTAAKRLGVQVMTSGPLGEAELVNTMAPHLDTAADLSAFPSTSSKLLYYARSVPDVLTTLVGHKRQANVESNLAVSTHEPLTPTQLKAAHRAIAESRLRAKRAETA